jgi:hypothetical protein
MSSTRSFLSCALVVGLAGCGAATGPSRGASAPPGASGAEASGGGPSCITLQRGVRGAVQDARISASQPAENFGGDVLAVAGSPVSGARETLMRFDLAALPRGARITRATLTIHRRTCGASAVAIHRVAAPWQEASVSWQSFGGAFERSPVLTSSNAGRSSRGLVPASFGVTDLVRSWASGELPNHGVLLRQESGSTIVATSESEAIETHPRLEVCFEP